MRILPSFLDSPLKYPVYNVTAGKPIDLVTIAHIINDKSNLKSKITAKKLGLNNEYTGDNTRLLEQIGDFKFTSIETAITELMVFYRQVI
jgi:GDP-L-fucose synthase